MDLGRLTYRRFLELFRHTVGLLGRVISLSQGLYLHRTAQHRKTWTNIHALSGIRTQEPTGQDPHLRPHGRCDRQEYDHTDIKLLRLHSTNSPTHIKLHYIINIYLSVSLVLLPEIFINQLFSVSNRDFSFQAKKSRMLVERLNSRYLDDASKQEVIKRFVITLFPTRK
jgi:hypothetical protein